MMVTGTLGGGAAAKRGAEVMRISELATKARGAVRAPHIPTRPPPVPKSNSIVSVTSHGVAELSPAAKAAFKSASGAMKEAPTIFTKPGVATSIGKKAETELSTNLKNMWEVLKTKTVKPKNMEKLGEVSTKVGEMNAVKSNPSRGISFLKLWLFYNLACFAVIIPAVHGLIPGISEDTSKILFKGHNDDVFNLLQFLDAAWLVISPLSSPFTKASKYGELVLTTQNGMELHEKLIDDLIARHPHVEQLARKTHQIFMDVVGFLWMAKESDIDITPMKQKLESYNDNEWESVLYTNKKDENGEIQRVSHNPFNEFAEALPEPIIPDEEKGKSLIQRLGLSISGIVAEHVKKFKPFVSPPPVGLI